MNLFNFGYAKPATEAAGIPDGCLAMHFTLYIFKEQIRNSFLCHSVSCKTGNYLFNIFLFVTCCCSNISYSSDCCCLHFNIFLKTEINKEKIKRIRMNRKSNVSFMNIQRIQRIDDSHVILTECIIKGKYCFNLSCF